jgi:hypothetical protein
MFIRKVECLAVRGKRNDRQDLEFLFDNFPLDMEKINKRVTVLWQNNARKRHYSHRRVVQILGLLDVKAGGFVGGLVDEIGHTVISVDLRTFRVRGWYQ